MDSVELDNARKILIDNRLIAYRKPLYQVLALEVRRSMQTSSEPTSLGTNPSTNGGRCKVIDYEQFCQIKAYRNEGLKAGQIADKLGLDPRTVAKWIDKDRFQLRLPGIRPSKLDPYKKEIIGMLERHQYTSAQIFQRIKDQGFDGGYTIVKDYVRKVRPKPHKPYLKLSFAPGECAQVDWGSYGSVAVGGTRRRLSFFVMVLCHSRMMYTEFTVSQTMEHFLGCHQRALQYFGGVPSKLWSII